MIVASIKFHGNPSTGSHHHTRYVSIDGQRDMTQPSRAFWDYANCLETTKQILMTFNIGMLKGSLWTGSGFRDSSDSFACKC